ncbi:DUF4031 domain-containing protein [Thalassospira xianhensis]|uniref:DUF4031 domain-containing protein n=2 Tax=Thalassospira TaxID=168934 RepID=A0A285TTV9_9PROT|nr:hypothetical protein TH5_02300 [Thalassospira xianhensis MCCC 1A02616]SOC27272.1 Protein of unknown function [Thalassospira xiamenensis]
MAIYVDHMRVSKSGRHFNHLLGTSLSELHEFAARLGFKRSWFHARAKYPHYDITDAQRERAISQGAIPVSSRDLIAIARKASE